MSNKSMIQEDIFHHSEFMSSATIKRNIIAPTIFIKRNMGSILLPQLSSKERFMTFELYLSDNLEMISMLKGTKKAIIAASKAAISDKNVGLGFMSPIHFNHERLTEKFGKILIRNICTLKSP